MSSLVAAQTWSGDSWPLPALELLGVFVFGLTGALAAARRNSTRCRCSSSRRRPGSAAGSFATSSSGRPPR